MAWLYYPTEFEKACFEGINSSLLKNSERFDECFKWKNELDEREIGETVFWRSLHFAESGKTVLGIESVSRKMDDVYIIKGERGGDYKDLSDELLTELFRNSKREGILHLVFPCQKNESNSLDLSLLYNPDTQEIRYSSTPRDEKISLSRAYWDLTKQADKIRAFDFTKVRDFTEKGLDSLMEGYGMRD